jgi:hypothetical protein
MRCHCIDCRKFSGSTNTNNMLVGVKEGCKVISGQLKTYTKTVESGNTMTSYFCDNCGSTLYRKTSLSDDVAAVMIGCVDGLETIEQRKPQQELFTRYRPSWMKPIEGAGQAEDSWLPHV